jgi:hypothetical protein
VNKRLAALSARRLKNNQIGISMPPAQTATAPQMTQQQKARAAFEQAKAIDRAQQQAIIPSARNRTVDKWEQIYTNTFAPAAGIGAGQQQIIQVIPQPWGLLKRFIVRVECTLVQGAAETQTKTTYGPANILSNITYLDTSNQPRCQTPGWHLNLMASTRRKSIFAAANTTDNPTGIGSIYRSITAPSSFTTSNNTFCMTYEVPIAYADNDLRGAVFMNSVIATASLNLTINPGFFVSSTGNPTFAGYQSSTAQLGVISSMTITVFQNGIDQLGNAVLPTLAMGTQYCLSVQPQGNPVANADQNLLYANNRTFLSTTLLYDNAGVLNAGTDIANIYIRTANGYNMLVADPKLISLWTKEIFNDDFPLGTYLLDHRHKPIAPNEYGNISQIVRCSSVTSVLSILYQGLEYMQFSSQLSSLQALSSAT